MFYRTQRGAGLEQLDVRDGAKLHTTETVEHEVGADLFADGELVMLTAFQSQHQHVVLECIEHAHVQGVVDDVLIVCGDLLLVELPDTREVLVRIRVSFELCHGFFAEPLERRKLVDQKAWVGRRSVQLTHDYDGSVIETNTCLSVSVTVGLTT